ncbi:hypothetical protein Glove_50g125 [Diversispora epigaea]|uniref:Uncharacterized protein n=1 Tax=Diversispora epigaea TaxID=1348612 RepID=A0A397JDT1_9GLOM|nr:hypothetical protein Glove_50g125 [Diversispora epigaea]
MNMSNYKKQKAKDLKCIFADLVEEYREIRLRSCGTSEIQKWRHASSLEAARRLVNYHDFIPELSSLSLKSYSICQTHYNQIISTNQFYEHLIGSTQEKKKTQLDVNKDNPAVHVGYMDSTVELNETRRLLEITQVENQQKSQLIIDLNNQIAQMQQFIDDKKNEVDDLRNRLQKVYDNIIEHKKLYDEQCRHNEILIEQWNSRFATQQKRIDAIIEIAKVEHKLLFENIELLIRDNSRFSVESLMVYSPREWLNRRNQVIVKFIETLIQNNHDADTLSKEKLFKAAAAIDLVYGARHRRYVSEVHLAISAIKYSIARSKMIIDIDNHITSSGSYSRFQKWLEDLSKHEEPLPEGLLFLTFDNEQRGQKNYLDRGFNTVIYHTVTSFVSFNMSSQNKLQHTDLPWMYDSLNKLQYEELFDVSPQMQEVIDIELHKYLADVLNFLSKEKSSSTTNTIDSLIASTVTNIANMKMCLSCDQQNIENRKKTCPKCGARLPTLAEIQKEKVTEVENNINDQLTNFFIFKPYSTNDEPSNTHVHRISLTQQRVIDQEVNVLEIYVPDPININPNSVANVEKVLLHIEKLSGIKDGTRKWIAVACDGVPYHYMTKLKDKFPWLVLILGQLHEEMNMLRAFVELNWYVKCYRTENQLAYFKKCADHHKSWDSICNIYRQAISMKLMWPYVKSHSDLSVRGYLTWVKDQQDSLYQIKFEQTFIYLQAIINYRKAIRTNDPSLKKAARRAFFPIWSARHHPIYHLIEVFDEVQLMKLRPEIRDIVEKNCVVSRSGIYEQHQGLDAILEEINKTLKTLIPPIPQHRH